LTIALFDCLHLLALIADIYFEGIITPPSSEQV
jgi:hypothetical protein